jgi:hypothetical protein
MVHRSDICLCNCGVNGHRDVCTRKATILAFIERPGRQPATLEVCAACFERCERDHPDMWFNGGPV